MTGGIVVAQLDRFARSAVDALTSIRRLTDSGARLVSVEDSFDGSTPMGYTPTGYTRDHAGPIGDRTKIVLRGNILLRPAKITKKAAQARASTRASAPKVRAR